MKTNELVKELTDTLDNSADGKNSKQQAAIKKLLKKLKHRKAALKDKIDKAKDSSEEKRLKSQLNVVQAHRKKGIKALRDLKGKS